VKTFESDLARELLVLRFVDASHPTGSDHSSDAVASRNESPGLPERRIGFVMRDERRIMGGDVRAALVMHEQSSHEAEEVGPVRAAIVQEVAALKRWHRKRLEEELLGSSEELRIQ
jgi:hypothetical protein